MAAAAASPAGEVDAESAEPPVPPAVQARRSVDSASEQVILCYCSSAEDAVPQSSASHRLVAMGRRLCWWFPAPSQSRMGQILRFHLLHSQLQAFVLITAGMLDRAHMRLVLFSGFPLLHAAILVRIIREAGTSRTVGELRQHEIDVKVKLWMLSAAAFLAPLMWGMEVREALKDQSEHSQDLVFALCMFAHYIVILAHFVHLARKYGSHLAQHVLRSKKLTSVRFDSLPGQCDGDAMCSVCLSDYEAHEQCVRLPCGHVYHASCILMWLQRSEVCPLRCEGAVLALPGNCKARRFGRWAPGDGSEEPGASAAEAPDIEAQPEPSAPQPPERLGPVDERHADWPTEGAPLGATPDARVRFSVRLSTSSLASPPGPPRCCPPPEAAGDVIAEPSMEFGGAASTEAESEGEVESGPGAAPAAGPSPAASGGGELGSEDARAPALPIGVSDGCRVRL